jgi:phage gp46-like protein
MALDRFIDPRTRDYVCAEGGELVTTHTAASAVYHAMATRQGTVLADRTAGSRLHELTLAVPGVEDLAVKLGELALDPLVAGQDILNRQVRAALTPAGLLIEVDAFDAASGEEIHLGIQ